MELFVHCKKCDKRINVKDAIVALTEDIGIPGSAYNTYFCKSCSKYINKFEHNRFRRMELNGEIFF